MISFGLCFSSLVFVFMQVHENIFKVVTVNFRNKVRVVFYEIKQEIRHLFVIFVRDQNLHVGLFLHRFGLIIIIITFIILLYVSIKDSSFEKLFYIFLLSFEVFHLFFCISKHFHSKTCPKKPFQVLGSVTLQHSTIF